MTHFSESFMIDLIGLAVPRVLLHVHVRGGHRVHRGNIGCVEMGQRCLLGVGISIFARSAYLITEIVRLPMA